MTIPLPPEARARLDHHLDAVEGALASAGNSREQRRAIMDDLESQITDMLAARSPTPTADDVAAVLAQLDQPQAYAGSVESKIAASAPVSPPPRPPNRPRLSISALAAASCLLVSFLAIAALLASGQLHLISTPPGEERSASQFFSEFREGKFRLVEVLPDGLLVGNYKDSHQPRISTRFPTSALDGAGWSKLVQLAQETGTPITAKPSPFSFLTKIVKLPLIALASAFGLLGTLLAWISFMRIRKSNGLLRGKYLALLTGLLGPLLLTALALGVLLPQGPP